VAKKDPQKPTKTQSRVKERSTQNPQKPSHMHAMMMIDDAPPSNKQALQTKQQTTNNKQAPTRRLGRFAFRRFGMKWVQVMISCRPSRNLAVRQDFAKRANAVLITARDGGCHAYVRAPLTTTTNDERYKTDANRARIWPLEACRPSGGRIPAPWRGPTVGEGACGGAHSGRSPRGAE